MLLLSLVQPVLVCLWVCCMRDLVEGEVLQNVMLVGHQDLRDRTRKNRKNVWLRLLNHYEQVPVRQEGMVILLTCRNHEQFIKAIEGSLFYLLHELTSLVLACTM